jgi:periplasmic divalent cation tolerance protein
MQFVEIRINCPDRALALRIAERLVEARLAPSANIGSAIDSIHRWQGAVRRAAEIPLLVKTRAEHFDAILAEVARLHPYDVPAITATPIVAAPAYAKWIAAETAP